MISIFVVWVVISSLDQAVAGDVVIPRRPDNLSASWAGESRDNWRSGTIDAQAGKHARLMIDLALANTYMARMTHPFRFAIFREPASNPSDLVVG
ncbi:MAG TPA: hypothetical protein VLA37_11235 [Sphingomonadaceae bacterium]|nr:hypothetical protein [Sphingomonadaceae bacterium]